MHIFIDEGGNFDFSQKGSKILTLTAVTTPNPSVIDKTLLDLRYAKLAEGKDLAEFHASEDKQAIRDEVFSVIEHLAPYLEVHSVIVDKPKTHPRIRDIPSLYPKLLKWLLSYVFNDISLNGTAREATVITDSIPHKKKRKAIEKGVKLHLARQLKSPLDYHLFHHDSQSTPGLQVVDYINWAIYRKWNSEDTRSYQIIEPLIKSEFDVFAKGQKRYY